MTDYHSQIISFLTQHGKGCLSYSGLQKGMQYFIMPERGYIAYYPFKHWLLCPLGREIVLADPVCAPKHTQDLIQSFLAKHKRAIFLQCGKSTADVLSAFGHDVNQFGQLCHLDLPFQLAGKPRSKVRQWRNKCIREGVTVYEKPLSAMLEASVKTLAQKWLQDKGGKELILLTRPFIWEDEQDVRHFWAEKDGQLIALAVFDPMYQDGQVVGYYHNFDRVIPKAPNGTGAFVLTEAMMQFEKENKKVVSLGLMPLFLLRKYYKQNDFLMKALRYAKKNLNNLYPFEGNISHKKKFAGRHEPVFFSSTAGNSLREMFIVLKAMRMI